MSIPLNKPSSDLIIDLINIANSSTLDETKITFAAPTVITPGQDGHNSTSLVSSIPGSGYRGNVTVSYIRLDIGLLFANIALNLNVTTYTSTKDLLPLLNSKFGLGLTTDDIQDNPIDKTGNPVTHTIVTKATSLAYIGQVTTTIGPDPDVGERLDTVILTTNLNGLLYPNGDTTKAQAREYSWGVDCSSISAWLQVRATDETITDNSLATELNKVVPDTWVYDANAAQDYNTAGATIVFSGANDPTFDTNQSFNRIVQVQLSDTLCGNVGGILTLGYNAS